MKNKRKQNIKTLILRNPHGRHTHTSSYTHASHTNLLVGALQLREKRANLASTRAAQRVTESNSTTLRVNLLQRETKLIHTPDALGSESLVDLVDANVVLRDAGLLQSNGDGLPGADAHQQRGHTNDAGGDVFAENLLAKTLSGRALHEQDGSGTVGDLRGVTGVDGALLGEGGLELGEAFGSHVLADTVVTVYGDLLLLA